MVFCSLKVELLPLTTGLIALIWQTKSAIEPCLGLVFMKYPVLVAFQ